MLRLASTSILILAGAVLLSLLALRLVFSAALTLSGVRRQRRVLNW